MWRGEGGGGEVRGSVYMRGFVGFEVSEGGDDGRRRGVTLKGGFKFGG